MGTICLMFIFKEKVMKNLAKNYNLRSVTRWVYINHPEWADDDRSVVTVIVERVTTLNGEIISKKALERQDHVLRLSAAEDMAAEAYLRMNSTNDIDEEVYVGF